MKRIILSGGILLFAVAVIAGGTGAFFSDQISSEDNVFTAGSVSLLVGDINHTYNGAPGDQPIYNDNGISFSLSDIKPLDEGAVTYTIQNGANDAIICAMVDESGSNDNGVNSPETKAGDLSNGPGAGELGAFLNFKIGSQTGSLASLSGVWQPVGTIDANTNFNSAINYCFGEFSGSDCVLDEDAVYNLSQTDSLTADVMFYAVQARNNDFTCAELNETQEIGNADLYTFNDRVGAFLSQDWFFYNDSNDTIMGIDQFSGSGGVNTIAAFAGSNGAAKMVLHDAGARYNIATYKFSATPLADINTLRYRIYDASVSSQTPYLHFNVDFNGTDTWQRRLVQVPTGVAANTWTEIDALAGNWTYSGTTWPAGIGEPGTTPGTTAKTWQQIKDTYPTAALRTTDSFFGIRVGHPGPIGEESYVDWIEFDGVKYDFAN